jgi:hypothetical protein
MCTYGGMEGRKELDMRSAEFWPRLKTGNFAILTKQPNDSLEQSPRQTTQLGQWSIFLHDGTEKDAPIRTEQEAGGALLTA